jgi:hypothetical protein
MAQPPWDATMELSANKPFYILHYTYGQDFTLDGKMIAGGLSIHSQAAVSGGAGATAELRARWQSATSASLYCVTCSVLLRVLVLYCDDQCVQRT